MRAIDADKLKEIVAWYDHPECVDITVSRVMRDIANAPTVDAYTEEDVRNAYNDGYSTGMEQGMEKGAAPHGRWMFKRGFYEADECNCSLCGQRKGQTTAPRVEPRWTEEKRMADYNCDICIHQNVCPAYHVTMPECMNYLPIGNVVPVVRCSECIHAEKGDRHFCDQVVNEYKWDGYGFERKPHKLEFCSYGERKK